MKFLSLAGSCSLRRECAPGIVSEILDPVPSAYGEVMGQLSYQKPRTIEAADPDILAPLAYSGTAVVCCFVAE